MDLTEKIHKEIRQELETSVYPLFLESDAKSNDTDFEECCTLVYNGIQKLQNSVNHIENRLRTQAPLDQEEESDDEQDQDDDPAQKVKDFFDGLRREVFSQPDIPMKPSLRDFLEALKWALDEADKGINNLFTRVGSVARVITSLMTLDKLDDINSDLGNLKKRMRKLQSAANQLPEQFQEVLDAIQAIDPGVQPEVVEEIQQIKDNTETLKSAATTISDAISICCQNMTSSFQNLSDSLSGIDGKLDEVKTGVGNLSSVPENIDSLIDAASDLGTKLDGLDTKLDGLGDKVDAVKEDTGSAVDMLTTVINKLSSP
jgi:septation ring formation regulator EzrA